MKKNNADGLNNASIGFTLATVLEKAEEALPYLSDALLDHVTELYRIVNGYANAYAQRGDLDASLSILLWLRTVNAGLRQPGVPSYLDKEDAQLLAACAVYAMQKGDAAAARQYLTEARALAIRFDAAPEYGFTGTRFFHGDKNPTAFDDFGDNTRNGISRLMAENDDPKWPLCALWAELDAQGDSEL